MALNPYFQQGARSEQNLIQDLINEQLRMYGVEIHYLPRKYVSEKSVIKEVVSSKFDDAYPIEAYIDNFDGYGDNPVLLSKFGIQQTNEVTLVISKERFETYISPLMRGEENVKLTTRPKEGDLIYFPLGDRLFEIKFVEHEKPFYQLQNTYVYELRCELFRYEDEVIATGVEEIDDELVGDDLADAQTEDGISTILGVTQTLKLVGSGINASAETNLVLNGGIRYISVLNRGGGYLTTPHVGVSSAPTGGITGIATALMIGGINVCNLNVNASARSVQEIQLINPGSGYTMATHTDGTVTPGIAITNTTGTGAAATAYLTNRGVGIVTITGGGSGFTTDPTVTFSTPIHVGAAATAVIDTPMVGGGVSVTRAVISDGPAAFMFPGGTTGGRFYKPGTVPTVTFDLPGGSSHSATADATLDDIALTGGTVLSTNITFGGRFYKTAPILTFSAPVNSGASGSIGIAVSSINPSTLGFTTTGRAYKVAPTVIIGTGSGTDTLIEAAVGIATIHPITGIVTAVSFDVADPWAVGTGATVGYGYTVTPTISFSGATAQERATATTTIDADGQVDSISIGNSGYGYYSTPSITINPPTAAMEEFRALGVATMRFDSVIANGTIGIGTTNIITGIDTTGILMGDRVRLENGYDDIYSNFIATDTYVTSIGIGTIYIQDETFNAGAATSSFEFGIDKCGIITGIAVTYGGGGYLEPPGVTIQNDVSVKNYHEIVAGVITATGAAHINDAGNVTDIWITDSGAKYVEGEGSPTPWITISAPSMDSTGDYRFNEIVTGATSGASGRVRSWSSVSNELEVASVSGTFLNGEKVIGSSSGASHALRKTDTMPDSDEFADNFDIETEADKILDFSETNPFGIP